MKNLFKGRHNKQTRQARRISGRKQRSRRWWWCSTPQPPKCMLSSSSPSHFLHVSTLILFLIRYPIHPFSVLLLAVLHAFIQQAAQRRFPVPQFASTTSRCSGLPAVFTPLWMKETRMRKVHWTQMERQTLLFSLIHEPARCGLATFTPPPPHLWCFLAVGFVQDLTGGHGLYQKIRAAPRCGQL